MSRHQELLAAWCSLCLSSLVEGKLAGVARLPFPCLPLHQINSPVFLE